MATDTKGNVVYVGTTAQSGKVNAKAYTLATNNAHMLVARISAGGTVDEVKTTTGNGGKVSPRDIVLDTLGNAYVTGTFSQKLVIGTSTLWANAAANAIFVARLGTGSFNDWGLAGPGHASNSANDIRINSKGLLYIAGQAHGQGAFGTIPMNVAGTFTSPSLTFGAHKAQRSGGQEVFVAKLNPSGGWAWVAFTGGSGKKGVSGLAVKSGYVVVSGWFEGQASFDGEVNYLAKTFSSTKKDAFVWRFKITGP